MAFDFKIYNYDYDERDGMLEKNSTGVVKCKKDFPIYHRDGKDWLFKPLSKTKPFTTPLFGISEVFWSTIIKEYFDECAPLYKLAICDGYDKHHPSRYSKGTIVESVVGKDEKLVNLLEYYLSHPDPSFDISNYINYCGMYYDYSAILNSRFFSENEVFGRELAKQILISILKNDINYHYENVALISKASSFERLSPPFDHEFSVPFLFPDNEILYSTFFATYNMTLIQNRAIDSNINLVAILNNIRLIATKYPEIALDFLRRLECFIQDFKKTEFILPKVYMEPLSSNLYEVYEAIYKEHDDGKQLHEIPKYKLQSIDIEQLTNRVKRDVLISAISYFSNLKQTLEGGRIITKK